MKRVRCAQVLAALVLLIGARAGACDMCKYARELTISAQELVYAERSVLAMPAPDRNEFRIVAVIKGDAPPGNTIADKVFRAEPGTEAMQSKKPLLLIRDHDWGQWVNFGAVNANQADLLRRLSTTKRTIDLTDAEWREHVAYFLPYLENAEPMIAEIAFNEFVSAPYGALRSIKSQLDVAAIRSWLNDQKLVNRQPVYLLLLGIVGTAQDARWIEQRMEAARKIHDATNLTALIGADLELRGPEGVTQIERLYLLDSARTEPEIEAALVALKVHGDTDSVASREAFNRYLRNHPTSASVK
jgi:hypothetical protein